MSNKVLKDIFQKRLKRLRLKNAKRKMKAKRMRIKKQKEKQADNAAKKALLDQLNRRS